MTEPRRVLIDADYAAGGIWWVPSKEELEMESPLPGYLGHEQRRLWPPSQELRDDLKAWNQAWEVNDELSNAAHARCPAHTTPVPATTTHAAQVTARR